MGDEFELPLPEEESPLLWDSFIVRIRIRGADIPQLDTENERRVLLSVRDKRFYAEGLGKCIVALRFPVHIISLLLSVIFVFCIPTTTK